MAELVRRAGRPRAEARHPIRCRRAELARSQAGALFGVAVPLFWQPAPTSDREAHGRRRPDHGGGTEGDEQITGATLTGRAANARCRST